MAENAVKNLSANSFIYNITTVITARNVVLFTNLLAKLRSKNYSKNNKINERNKNKH